MAFSIRAATRDDMPAAGRLGALLVRQHHAFDPERFMLPDGDVAEGYAWFLGTQLGRRDAAVLVAEDEGRVIGYVYAAIEPRNWQLLLEESGVIHDVVVDDAARRRGVATALTHAAIAWLRQSGMPRVVLATAERNGASQALFSGLGFRRTMIEWTKEIGGA